MQLERVMHEFKHGELETSRGKKVKNPKQAIRANERSEEIPAFDSRTDRHRRAVGRRASISWKTEMVGTYETAVGGIRAQQTSP
jgi:hypothetical protein